MKNKIVVIGSSNVDLIMKMDHLPGKGETVSDALFFQIYGGKGANTAVGAARAGGSVSFINCVGEDAYTPVMVENLRNDGIDCSMVFQEKGLPSGHALVMIGGDGNNYLSVAPGANYRLTPSKIDMATNLINEAAIILLQNEIPVETTQYILSLAEKINIPVLWNFAPARFFPEASMILKTDILVVNEIEARHLSGIEITSENDLAPTAEKLLKMGASTVVITLGADGSYTQGQEFCLRLPAFKVKALDATAAGDVFCGTLAVALTENKPWKEALRFASAASAISVTKIGAQPSAPKREDIDMFLKQNKQVSFAE